MRIHQSTLVTCFCFLLCTAVPGKESTLTLDDGISELRTLVDSGRFAEAKGYADNLEKQLAAEATQREKELDKARLDDNWLRVETLAKELAADKRRRDILKFLSEKAADPDLAENKRAHFADVAVSSLAKVEEKPITVFDHLTAAGLQLRRTSDSESADAGKGALFGLSENFEGDSETELTADFFLSWSPHRMKGSNPIVIKNQEVLWEASLEGHLNSTDDETADAWKLRVSRNSIYRLGKGKGIHLDLSAKLEADRDFDRQRSSGEVVLTADNWDIGMGRFWPHTDVLIAEKKPEAESPVQVRWRPYFIADIGDIVSGDERNSDSAVWLTGRLKVEVALNFMKDALGVESFTLFADGRSLYATDDESWHSFLETGIDVMFSENVGWTALYKVGESSPDFDDTNLFTTGVTVKF